MYNKRENTKTEEKYLTFFQESPTPLWEEDFSEVEKHIAGIQNKGTKNIKKYFEGGKGRLVSMVSMLKVTDVNKAALGLYEAKNEKHFKKLINKLFLKDAYDFVSKVAIATIEGKRKIEGKTVIRTFNGKKKYVFIKLVITPELKKIKRFLISIIDITSLKKAEEKKHQSETRYRSLFENSLDGIYICNSNGEYIDANPALAKILGYKSKEMLLSLNTPELLYFSKKDRPLPYKKNKPFETRLKKKDGTVIWVEICSGVINDTNGQICYQGIVRDITKRKKREDEIKYLSFHDKLTNLYNRAYFDEELKRLDTKRQFPLSVVLGDVTGLKIINNAFGHERGDDLLAKIAKIMKDCFRHEDIIARWGGNEFIILLPKTAAADTLKIIERINRKCKKENTENLPLGLSFGSSVKTDISQDIRAIIKEAEDRMYQHKLVEKRHFDGSIISSLEKTLEERDYETEKHIKRMRDNAVKFGKALSLDNNVIDELDLLATLHDIGKVAIADNIILKPGELASKEWEEMKRHPEVGYRIAQASQELSPIAKSILFHHEWWNGTGYPRGIKGNKIPLTSRIISIVDAYDAMTNDRPYRKAISKKKSKEELKSCAGIQFDPQLVDKFIRFLK